MAKIVYEVETINSVLQYLYRQPYMEVAAMIDSLQAGQPVEPELEKESNDGND